MQWFRMYGDMPDDPKVGTLSDSEFRTWVELLCFACREERNGETPATPDNVDWLLRRKASDSIPALLSRGLIRQSSNGRYLIANWEGRQTRSDSSKGRVSQYRDRLKKLGKTTDYLKHREEVCNRYGNACVYCGGTDNICIDHLVPLIRGGDNSPDNLVTACKKCNSGKAGKLFEETGYSFHNPLAQQCHVTVSKLLGNGYSNALEKRRVEKKREDSNLTGYTAEFEELWRIYPRKDGSKADAFKFYKSAIREGIDHGRIIEGIRKLADHVKRTGMGKRYIPHGSTWLHQRRWEADYSDDIPYEHGKPSAPVEPRRSKWDIEGERLVAKYLGTQPEGQGMAGSGSDAGLQAPEILRPDGSRA